MPRGCGVGPLVELLLGGLPRCGRARLLFHARFTGRQGWRHQFHARFTSRQGWRQQFHARFTSRQRRRHQFHARFKPGEPTPPPIFLRMRARAAAELHRPARRLARRPDRWHTQPLNAHVNPIGGAWAPLPALPPKGLALQLWGPGSHPSGPAATFHAIELRRQEPSTPGHSLDTKADSTSGAESFPLDRMLRCEAVNPA